MSDEPTEYEVRLTEVAEMEVAAAYETRRQFAPTGADRWYAGLGRALDSLAQFPKRLPLAPESDVFGGGVRQLVYGKTPTAYRILFLIVEPDDEHFGLVRVLHVRHGAQQRFGEFEE